MTPRPAAGSLAEIGALRWAARHIIRRVKAGWRCARANTKAGLRHEVVMVSEIATSRAHVDLRPPVARRRSAGSTALPLESRARPFEACKLRKRASAPVAAETWLARDAHASTHVLAAFQLAIGPKTELRNARAGFPVCRHWGSLDDTAAPGVKRP